MNTKTTTETITIDQIATLRDEARAHGDEQAVEICTDAINGNAEAIADCVDMIASTEVMTDCD